MEFKPDLCSSHQAGADHQTSSRGGTFSPKEASRLPPLGAGEPRLEMENGRDTSEVKTLQLVFLKDNVAPSCGKCLEAPCGDSAYSWT